MTKKWHIFDNFQNGRFKGHFSKVKKNPDHWSEKNKIFPTFWSKSMVIFDFFAFFTILIFSIENFKKVTFLNFFEKFSKSDIFKILKNKNWYFPRHLYKICRALVIFLTDVKQAGKTIFFLFFDIKTQKNSSSLRSPEKRYYFRFST